MSMKIINAPSKERPKLKINDMELLEAIMFQMLVDYAQVDAEPHEIMEDLRIELHDFFEVKQF